MAACPSCGKENPEGFQFCGFCTAPLTGDSREQRKTVTVLFCDVTGSTALGESTDPETLRALLARYFERMRGIVESHGGTVEKFIGDAVMAVFGVPVAHEDDALRACRAAAEMRDALPELGIGGRIGVNTGEVVTGTSERLATGDAVNVAARLEQAAVPGEVLIGEGTYELAREAVVAEPVEPLALKGKAEPVRAYRLIVLVDAPERVHGARFVGRERELAVVRANWERACSEARCQLLTVVGEAGVGKSRLVMEALAPIDCHVVGGRCLPYGEGITYWPVVEVLKQLGVLPSDPAAAAAIRSLLGESDESTSAEEIAWGFRNLLDEQAPLVVLFDDIQWADETFLDLVEAAALLTRDAPLLLLCMARPELIERRPSWPVPIRLEPLAAEEAEQLLPDSLDDELRDRIASAAGGNPLFLTEMGTMASETKRRGDRPASLRALLAARLDQLEPDERSVLERGAVEGEIFHRGAVQALSPDGQVTPRLAALVRHELIRPDKAQLPGDEAFRFHHLLLRDAAYDALPKSLRADLHQRFADWLEHHGPELVELDEILGYHLERAAGYHNELGRESREIALAAGDRLGLAGRRAFWRSDWRTPSRCSSARSRSRVRTGSTSARARLLRGAADPAGGRGGRRCCRRAGFRRGRPRRGGGGPRRGSPLPPARSRGGGGRAGGARARGGAAARTGAGPRRPRPRLVRAWLRPRTFTVASRSARERRRKHCATPGSLGSDGRPCSFSRRRLPPDRGLPMRRSRPSTRCCQRRLTQSRSGAEAGSSPCSAVSTKRGRLHTRQASGSSNSPATTGQPTFCLPRSRRSPVTTRQLLITSVVYASGTSRRAGKTSSRRSHRGLGSRCAPSVATTRPSRWRERAASSATCTTFQCRRFGDRCSRSSTLHRGQPGEGEALAREAVALLEPTDGLGLQAGRALSAWPRCSRSPASATRQPRLHQALERYERKRNLVMAERTRTRLAELT